MYAPQSPERFRLRSRIGMGGMGEVYRAEDRSNGATVAVKLLRKGATPEERARFQREVQVLADLRHPGLVAYVDHGVWTDGRPYFAMEWLEGEDLAQRQRRAPLGMSDAVETIRRTAQAIAAVHARGVIHRDLKMSNIFIVQGNLARGVKVIDFGVVKPPDPDGFDTLPGSIIGTPYFMAPEQARGRKVTTAADVYSLGAVLFRLLTGRHVFEADHVIAFLGRLVLEDPPPVSMVRFDVPEELEALLLRCLSRTPEDRPADAGELARLLARLPALNNQPPNSDQSASAIRRVAAETPSRVQAPTSEPQSHPSSQPAPPAARARRVVAVLLAAVPSAGLDADTEQKIRLLLGDDATLDELQGGRIIAALGLGRTLGDEAVRAARAALLLATRVSDARVALATGHAVPGRLGLAGEALERAAAQLERAAPGGIRVSKAMQPLLQGRFVVRSDDFGGVLLHEDIAASDSHKVLGVTTPTLGRDVELELLAATFRAVMADAVPRAVVLMGPTGIGKSRIRHEATTRLVRELDSVDVLMARGDSMQPRSGLSALGRALRSRMGIRDGEPAALQTDRVVRYVAQRPSCPVDSAAFVGEFVGVPFSDSYSESLRAARESPHVMNMRILQALEYIIRHDAAYAPQVLVLEDLHLLDDTTVEMVDWLLGCDGLRLVVWAFGRDEMLQRFPKLWEKRASTRVTLGPLPAASMQRIAAMVLPQFDDRKRQSIVDRAEGNPLFLEELLRHSADGRDDLPISVQALIQARLDLLPPEQRQVVRAASVFGRQFWTDGVSALLGRDCEADLIALAEAEILVPQETSRIEGQSEWTFPQNAVFETAYSSLVPTDREALHRAASEWLLVAGEEDIGSIARHAEAGADRSRAAVLYARASSQAYANGQLEAALDFADRSIACSEDQAVRAQALLQRSQVLAWLGRYEDQLGAADQAAELADQGTDLWGEAQRLAGSALREKGRSADADMRLSWALTHPLSHQLSPATQARIHAERTRALVDLGRPHEARDVAERAVEIAAAAGERGTNAMLRALDARFMALAFLGDFSASIDAARDVALHADQAGDAALATRARINLGFVLNRVGRFEDARDELSRALHDARMLRIRAGEGFALHNLGMCHARVDDLDVAIQLEREAFAIGEEIQHVRLTHNAKVYEALMLVWRGGPGDLGAALAAVQQVRSEASSYPVTAIEAASVLAYVQLARHAFDSSIEACEDAMARLAAVGSVEEGEELLRMVHVEALLALGRESDADKVLAAAWKCVIDRSEQLSDPAHREAFLSRLYECQRIVTLGTERLGFLRPQHASLRPPPAVPHFASTPDFDPGAETQYGFEVGNVTARPDSRRRS